MDLEQKNKERQTKKRTGVDMTTMVYGKVPPQAKDLEEAVLGALLIERDAYDTIADILQPEMFYVDAHQKIYSAMRSLSKKSQPLDIHTAAEELRAAGELEMIGGPYYLTKLTNTVVSSAHIVHHSKIIIQKFIQRELIRISGEVIQAAYEDGADPFQMLDEAEEAFSQIGQALDFGDMVPIDTVLIQTVKKIQEWRDQDSSITGVTSGFNDLDVATRGWQGGDLIILAARPSVGKTAFALNIIRNAAMSFQQNKKTVAVWSLEMKSMMLVLRMLAAESEEILYRIQTGRIDDASMQNLFTKGIKKLAGLRILFDDKSGLTIQKLRSKARKMKRKNNLGLIVVDYLQLMTPEERSGNREQEVSKISRNLKNLAHELDVPIIALSQMSREFEKRVGAHKIPQLSDLRESGSLEQDGDVIMFLWGPTDQDIAEDASLLNRVFLKIAKQRNGVLRQIDFDFRKEIQLFKQFQKLPELGAGNWKPVSDAFTESKKKSIDAGNQLESGPDDQPF
jgi:replicative DNA helicase